MQTRLAAFCDRVIEAGWLAAMVTAPLYFQALSSRVFEPDKLMVIRGIALVILLAWAVQKLETLGGGAAPARAGGRSPSPDSQPAQPSGEPRRNWLFWPVVALVGAFLIATICSVAPSTSLWGSYQRLQGLYSFLAYVVVGLAIATHMRSRAQLDRLLTTAILVSVPVSIYGLVQFLQRDPMPWTADVTQRVSSTMGNAIFVAAYLILVVPPTFIRLLQSWDDLRAGNLTQRDESVPLLLAFAAALLQNVLFFQLIARFGIAQGVWWTFLPITGGILALCLPFFYPMRSRAALLARIAGYGFTLLAQLAAIVLSQSRGPWVGLIVGLAVVGLALALLRLGRRGMFAAAAACLAFGLLVAVMNVPNGPLTPLRSIPYFGRLSTLLEAESGTGKVRILIWESTLRLFLQHPSPGLEPDRLNALRPLVGYGPETLFYTFNPVYPPELAHIEARNASPDRAHNETLQNLVEIGLLGEIAFWVLTNLIMFHLLEAAGLVPAGPRRAVFWLVGVFGVFGVLGYLLFSGLRGFQGARVDPAISLPAIGLLGAVVAHFVEIQVGIAIAVTRTYFFAYGGAAVALTAWRWARETATAAEPAAGRAAEVVPAAPAPVPSPAPSPVRALTPAVAMAVPTASGRGAVHTSSSSRARAARRRGESGGSAASPKGGAPATDGDLVRAHLWAPAVYIGVTVLLAMIGGAFNPLMDPRAASIMGYGWLILGILSVAWAMTSATSGRFWHAGNAIFILPLLAVLYFGLIFTAAPTEADILQKRGVTVSNQGDWIGGLPDILAAANLQPDEDYYDLQLGRSFMELSKTLSGKPETNFNATMPNVLALRPDQIPRLGMQDALRASETVLLNAQRLAPLNTDHYANLGRLYRYWAESGNADKRDAAVAWYLKATRMSPDSAHLRDELAQAYLTAQQYDQAIEAAQQSYAIDPEFDGSYRTLVDAYQALGDWDTMLAAYKRALLKNPEILSDPRLQSRLTALMGAGKTDDLIALYTDVIAQTPRAKAHQLYQPLGVIYARSGRTAEAIDAFEQAVQIKPDDWNTYRNLATLYGETGRLDEGIAAIKRAIQYAPADRRAEFAQYQQQLEQRKAAGR